MPSKPPQDRTASYVKEVRPPVQHDSRTLSSTALRWLWVKQRVLRDPKVRCVLGPGPEPVTHVKVERLQCVLRQLESTRRLRGHFDHKLWRVVVRGEIK